MATDAYWQKTRSQLFDRTLGAVHRIPMREQALAVFGPMSANADVVKLMVLGCHSEAQAILDDYVPRLEALVRSEHGPAADSSPQSLLPQLLSDLSFGIWLRNGDFDPKIARWAFNANYERALRANDFKVGPTFTLLLTLALECGDDSRAAELYRTHHKAALEAVPQDHRLMNGQHHILGLTAMFGRDEGSRKPLIGAVKQFAARARHWDKGIAPVAYVSIVPLTRILVQCLHRLAEPAHGEALWALVR